MTEYNESKKQALNPFHLLHQTMTVLAGSAIMGAGIAMAIASGWGADPLAWVWEGLTRVLPFSLLGANLLLAGLMLIPPLLADRSQIGPGTILQPLAVGITNALLLPLLDACSGYLVFLPAGLVLLGIGAGIYNSAQYGRNSYDCCIFMIARRTGRAVGLIRSLGDLFLCLVALLLCGGQPSYGPLLAIVIIGPVMNATLNILSALGGPAGERTAPHFSRG